MDEKQLVSELSDLVYSLDGNNYGEVIIHIKDLLNKLRANKTPNTLSSVSEIFGDDAVVREILNSYINQNKEGALAGLEDYLLSSVNVLNKNEDSQVMDTNKGDIKIKDVEVVGDGMVKALVELPVKDAAKVLAMIESDEMLGKPVAEDLAKIIISGDKGAEISEELKPVSGRVVQIIDTRTDIDPENFSVSEAKKFNKYLYMFSEAINPEDEALEALAAEQTLAQCCSEEAPVEEGLESPEEIPVRSTIIESNSTLPTVEDVAEASEPASFIDSEMVDAGEDDVVDALDEITGSLAAMPVDNASEALGLIAENVGFSTAEAIQAEVLSLFSEKLADFSRNSWVTDEEVFAAYNVMSNYINNRQNVSFSTTDGLNSVKTFKANFSLASKIIAKEQSNFANVSFLGRVVGFRGSKAAEVAKQFEKNADKLPAVAGRYKRMLEEGAEEIRGLKVERARLLKKLDDPNSWALADNQDLAIVNQQLANARKGFDQTMGELSKIIEKKAMGDKVEEHIAKGLGSTLKDNWGKVALGAGGLVGAGAIGGMALATPASDSFDSVGDDLNYGFSDNGEDMDEDLNEEVEDSEKGEEIAPGVTATTESETMDAVVDVLKELPDTETISEVLSEVAEDVGPEVALAIQLELCKEDSDLAEELAEDFVVSADEVQKAAGVVAKEVQEGPSEESFSNSSKLAHYKRILRNFSILAQDEDTKNSEFVGFDEDSEEDALKQIAAINALKNAGAEEEAEAEEEDLEDEVKEAVAKELVEEDLKDAEIYDGSTEMDEVVDTLLDMPSIKDASDVLVEIEEKVGPEAALAVQSEVLKNDSGLFDALNKEFVLDDGVVKEIYSIVKDYDLDAPKSFSRARSAAFNKYVSNFAAALPAEQKDAIIEEVKKQVMEEMAAGAPVPPPAEGEGMPLPPPEVMAQMPAPVEGAAPVPPAPMPMPMPVPPEQAVAPAPAPVPPVPPAPVPAPAPAEMPPPGALAAPQDLPPIDNPGTQIPVDHQLTPSDIEGVMPPDIAPVIPAMVPPVDPVENPAPMTSESVMESPALPMELPTEAVATSTTGNFHTSAVNAPKYVHLIPQTPSEQLQSTMNPVPPVVNIQQNPMIPAVADPAQGAPLSKEQINKLITDNFSKIRKPANFSSNQKQADIDEYISMMA